MRGICLAVLFSHIVYRGGNILTVYHGTALCIYYVSLLVHYVVIVKDILSAREVFALETLLRILYGVGENRRIYRLVIGKPQPVYKSRNPVASEETHEVIFKREIKSALARVALSAGTSAELIVYTAAFMAFRAHDEKTACRLDFFRLRRDFRLELRQLVAIERAPLVKTLATCSRRYIKNIFFGKARFLQLLLGKKFRIASEHDIRTTACHICRNGHSAEFARLRDYLGFFFMILRIEHIVTDAARFQYL